MKKIIWSWVLIIVMANGMTYLTENVGKTYQIWSEGFIVGCILTAIIASVVSLFKK